MDFRKNIKLYISLSVTFALITLGLFILKSSKLDTDLLIDTGIFADYGSVISGILSTFFGLLSILLVIQTLNEQEKQNELQNIESRFFELLKIQRENVQEFQQKGRTGRRVTVDIYDEFDELYLLVKHSYIQKSLDIETWKFKCAQIAYLILFFGLGKNSRNHLKVEIQKIINSNEVYEIFNIEFLLIEIKKYDETKLENSNKTIRSTRRYLNHDGQQSRLGHYFRHLFQTVKFIDNQPSRLLSYKDKYFYLKTLRAQLSNYEQAILFYNSFTYLGEEWELAVNDVNRKLITKYNFIKNIPQGFTNDLNPKFYFPNVFFEFEREKSLERKRLEKHYS